MSERKCVLSQCCCGCTLKTGAWVTAILCLIGSTLQLIGGIYNAVNGHESASWLSVILNAAMFIVTILLCVGLKKEHTMLIRVWVYTQFAICVIGLFYVVILTIISVNLFVLLFGLLVYGINLYLILVVRSHAIELDEGAAAVGKNPA